MSLEIITPTTESSTNNGGGGGGTDINKGTSANRPNHTAEVQLYLDTDLNYIIFSDGTNWRNMSGAIIS